MMTSNFSTVFIEQAMQAFVGILTPITNLSYTATADMFNPGDTIKIPFAQNTSASANFDYTNGYNTTSTFLDVRDVTLSNLVYQRFSLTDTDIAKLNNDALTKLASQCGERLANDVIQTSLTNTVTDANFPTSASCVYTSLNTGSNISDLVEQCDNSKWPLASRNLILNPAAYNVLLKNSTLNTAFSYGGSQVVQDGAPTKVQGFNIFKTTTTMPNSCNGLVLNPNSILTAFGTHKLSGEAANKIVSYTTASDKNGITISLRAWYDAIHATTIYTVDCLFGNAVGQGGALFQMK